MRVEEGCGSMGCVPGQFLVLWVFVGLSWYENHMGFSAKVSVGVPMEL